MIRAKWLVLGAVLAVTAACGGKANDGNENNESPQADDESQNGEDAGAVDDPAADDGEDDPAADDSEDDAVAPDDGAADDDASDDAASDDSTDEPPVASTTPTQPTPTAGPPVMPTVTPPIGSGQVLPAEGCVDQNWTSAVDYCSGNRICADGSGQYSSCSRQADGTWYCDCSTNKTSGTYLLANANGENACDQAIALCEEAPSVNFTEPAQCTETSPPVTQPQYCESYLQCRQTAPIEGSDAQAVRQDYNYTYCYDNNRGGVLDCSCNGNAFSRGFTLEGTTPAEACSVSAAVCDPAGSAQFEGESTCTESETPESTASCSLQRSCGVVADLGNGIIARTNDSLASSCSATSDGQWNCSCSVPNKYLNFRAPAAETSPTQCRNALAVCETDEVPVPEGEIQCSRSVLSSGIGYCDASIDCWQNAQVGDQEIGVLGNLYTNCREVSTGVWSCNCNSNTQSVTFELQGTDARETCVQAADSCPDRVQPNIGNGGGVSMPGLPTPLPAGTGRAK